MTQEILHKTERIIIGYDSDEKWLFTDWIGYQSIDDIKYGGEKILEYLVSAKTTQVLNDNRHVTGSWSSAAEWAGTDWLPRMVAEGLKHFAWIYSPSALARISSSFAVDAGGKHAEKTIRMFSDIEKAKAWLRANK